MIQFFTQTLKTKARRPFSNPALAIDAPCMPDAVIGFFSEQLRQATCYLEFGAGGSTVLAARQGVDSIVSIESDKRYLDSVEQQLLEIDYSGQFVPLHVDIGPTGAWGKPKTNAHFQAFYGYSQAGFQYAAQQQLSPDLILIDGRFRVACFYAALLAAPGALCLFDDYAGRSEYKVIEQYVKPQAMVDRMAVFTLPIIDDIPQLAFEYARYSVISK